VAEREFGLIADDQAFALAPFMAGPWAAMGNNVQHQAANRGRIVASDAYNRVQVDDDGVATEVARYVFDATPLETNYRVAPIVFIPPWLTALEYTVLIESEDTAGGNTASDSYPDKVWRRTGDGDRDQGPAYLQAALNLTWPLAIPDQGGWTASQSLGWFNHTVNAALPTQGRVLKVSLTVADANFNTYLISTGCVAVGYRA